MSDVSQLTLTVVRVAFLVLLWLFVLTTVSVMRSDLFGPSAPRRPRTPGTTGPRVRAGGAAPGLPPLAVPRAGGTSPTAGGPTPGTPPYQPSAPAPGGRRGRRRRHGRLPQAVVVTAGASAGRSVRLGAEPITIGRAPDATLVLSDEYASAHHARLVERDGQWWVEDLGSTNGTYVDGVRITGPRPVPPGMPIRVGKTTLELQA